MFGYLKHNGAGTVPNSIVLNSGGSGYNIGDQVSVDGGNDGLNLEVTDVDGGGAVLSFSIVDFGSGYSDHVNSSTTNIVNDTGSGFTVDVVVGYITPLTQSFSSEAGDYLVTIKAGGLNGTMGIDLGDASTHVVHAGAGSTQQVITSSIFVSGITITPSKDFDGIADNISVKEVLSPGVYGPELVTNGTFEGTTGWEKSGLPAGWVYRGALGDEGTLPTYAPSLASVVARVQQGIAFPKFIVGGLNEDGNYALFKKSNTYGFNVFRGPVWHIGFDFRVLEVDFALHKPVVADASITPVLRFDAEELSSAGTEINDTNYPDPDTQHITLNGASFPNGVKGKSHFYLEFQFNGPALMAVSLPVTVKVQNEKTGEISVFSISTIFEGLQPSALFGSEGQYQAGIGIDPDVPATDDEDDLKTGGIIRPVSYEQFSGEDIDSAPIAVLTNPKDSNVMAILASGRMVQYDQDLSNETLIGQLQEGGMSPSDVPCRGADYYNNYYYMRTPHDVSRYGPLDNSPSLTNEIWTGATLGTQDPLTDAEFPTTLFGIGYLNHFGTTHVDGALYFLDFVAGTGYVHKIKTKKVTDQGDTDDGSSFGILDLPPDYVPITISPYGEDLVVGASFTTDPGIIQGLAALFFFSPVDIEPSFYRKVQVPDVLCSVLKYNNGVLLGLSGDIGGGYRIFQYAGGDTIDTLGIIEDGYPPLQGAADSVGNRLVWAANTSTPIFSSGLYAWGSKSDLFPRGIHNIAVLSNLQI